MRITRRQLRRTLRKVLRESVMKNMLGEIENAILACGQEQGGEMTIDDCIPYVVAAAPMMDRPGSKYDELYNELVDIMWDMVDAGLLTGGYEDFFSVHPDYM